MPKEQCTTPPKRYTLSKTERLSWKRHIDCLFQNGQSFIAFPLRVVYLPLETQEKTPLSILISVPKKRMKHAVDRNHIKRLVRENFRLQKYDLADPLQEKQKSIHIAFLFVDKEMPTFSAMQKAMSKALRIIREKEC